MKFRKLSAFLTALILSLLLILQSGCQKEPDMDNKGKTIAGWISADPLFYSILDSSLRLTGLYDTLKSNGPFTMLAPENNAFGVFNTNNQLNWPFSLSLLRNNMIFHIIPGIKKAEDLPSGPNAIIPTLTGDSAFVSKNARGIFINGFRIQPSVYEASNGIVHRIEQMQIAADGTVMETIGAMLGFDSLNKAINRVMTAPGGDPAFRTMLGSSRISLFAPENTAFSDLLQSMSLTDINQIPLPQLLSILRYNIIPGKVFIPDLPEGPQQTIGGGTISIHWVSPAQDIPFIKGAGNGGTDTNVLTRNILCYNGLIHITEKVLLP